MLSGWLGFLQHRANKMKAMQTIDQLMATGAYCAASARGSTQPCSTWGRIRRLPLGL